MTMINGVGAIWPALPARMMITRHWATTCGGPQAFAAAGGYRFKADWIGNHCGIFGSKTGLDIDIYVGIYIIVMREKGPVKFIPLHNNWFHILLSLVGNEQHGYGIMQEVLGRTNGAVRIWPATLYGTLQRLISNGLIEESDERPVPELDDARRRYYKLTRLGRRVLDLECERLQEMLRMVQRKRNQEAF
jgi:DNA-binding PadR family transcriptional regulator